MQEMIKAELEEIRAKAGGLLHAVDVVAYARKHSASALNAQFEWNDGEAAEQFRLYQARAVIRAVVVVMQAPNGADIATRAYIALPSDRRGYRAVGEVISNRELADEALNRFLSDIERLRLRYSAVAMLSGILDQVTQRVEAERSKTPKGKRKRSSG